MFSACGWTRHRPAIRRPADVQKTLKRRETGFTSAATMGEVFPRELGMTPSAYRKLVIADRGDQYQ